MCNILRPSSLKHPKCSTAVMNSGETHEVITKCWVCPTTTLRYAPSVVRACPNLPFCDGTKVNASRIAGDGWRHFKNPLATRRSLWAMPVLVFFLWCLTHNKHVDTVDTSSPNDQSDCRDTGQETHGKTAFWIHWHWLPADIGWPGENPPDEKRWVLVSVSLVKLMITPQWCKDFKTNRMIKDDSINTNRDWTQQMWFLSNNNNNYFPIDVSTCFNKNPRVRIFCAKLLFSKNRNT